MWISGMFAYIWSMQLTQCFFLDFSQLFLAVRGIWKAMTVVDENTCISKLFDRLPWNFLKDSHGPETMNANNIVDLQTFHLV